MLFDALHYELTQTTDAVLDKLYYDKLPPKHSPDEPVQVAMQTLPSAGGLEVVGLGRNSTGYLGFNTGVQFIARANTIRHGRAAQRILEQVMRRCLSAFREETKLLPPSSALNVAPYSHWRGMFGAQVEQEEILPETELTSAPAWYEQDPTGHTLYVLVLEFVSRPIPRALAAPVAFSRGYSLGFR